MFRDQICVSFLWRLIKCVINFLIQKHQNQNQNHLYSPNLRTPNKEIDSGSSPICDIEM